MTPTKVFTIFAFLLAAHSSISKSLSVHDPKMRQLIEGQGLYSPDDDVEILTNANFRNLVFRQNEAWIIEFYNSWCGFCQRFAPSWKALATDTKLWKRMIKVGAIDCADDANGPLCREFEIMGYPTLRYFHEFYLKGIGEDVKKGTDLEEHKNMLLKHMMADQHKGKGTNFPNLLPYKYSGLQHLFSETNPNAKYAFLIVDNAVTLIGPQLELDFDSIKEIGIRYAVFNNSDLISNLHIKELPYMIALDDKNVVHRFPGHLKTREEFRQAIIQHVKPTLDIQMQPGNAIFKGKWLEAEVPDMAALMQEKERQAIRQKIKEMGDAVYQVDLETALRRSLKNEVASHSVIDGEKLIALRRYVNILRKYFPFGRNGQIFLMNLFSLVNSKQSVKGQDIAHMIAVNEPDNRMVFSSNHNWMACEGSTSAKRGYPCGLWKLFHYLTVQAADDVDDPREVLYGMYGYIKNFFGCTDCSQHFQEMAKKRDIDGVSTLNAAVLWLWSAHNEVNDRLSGDVTEDAEYPKVQFPSAVNCPLCRYESGNWNYPEVLRYLKTMYSRYNVKYLGSDVRVLQQPRIEATSASSVFEQIDAKRISKKDVRT